MIVGSRIHQMAQNFFPRPLGRTRPLRRISIVQLQQQRLGLSHRPAQIAGGCCKNVSQNSLPPFSPCPLGLILIFNYKLPTYPITKFSTGKLLPIRHDAKWESQSHSKPSSFHFLSTSSLVFSSIKI